MTHIKNDFTNTFHVDFPLIQAPMAGGPTTPELVSAVSNVGALGSLGAAYLQPQDLQATIQRIKKRTSYPFSVNLFTPPVVDVIPIEQQHDICNILNTIVKPLAISIDPIQPPYTPDFEKQLEVILAEKIAIFSCIFGIPDSIYLNALKQNHCKLIGTATCLDEAEQLEASGFDAVVAQGIEAGGHRGTFLPNPKQDRELTTLELVKELSGKISLPIVAAGGIATKEHLEKMLSAGASACQMGTAFLTTIESGANVLYKQALLAFEKNNDSTITTRGFSGRKARAISNTFARDISKHQDSVLPFPAQNKLTSPVRAAATTQKNLEFMSLWAGKNASYCQELSAHDLIEQLFQE